MILLIIIVDSGDWRLWNIFLPVDRKCIKKIPLSLAGGCDIGSHRISRKMAIFLFSQAIGTN